MILGLDGVGVLGTMPKHELIALPARASTRVSFLLHYGHVLSMVTCMFSTMMLLLDEYEAQRERLPRPSCYGSEGKSRLWTNIYLVSRQPHLTSPRPPLPFLPEQMEDTYQGRYRYLGRYVTCVGSVPSFEVKERQGRNSNKVRRQDVLREELDPRWRDQGRELVRSTKSFYKGCHTGRAHLNGYL